MQHVTSPVSNLVNPLLTDLYQITMAYAYWKSGKADEASVFDLYFRKNPFEVQSFPAAVQSGEFTIFCGLEEALRFLSSYKFTEPMLSYLKERMPQCEDAFFQYLRALDCSQVKVYAIKEGSVVFPNIPLMRIEGPLGICQLLETTLLTLVNYPSLIATNAARYRIAAEATGKKDIALLEFGLRRAQGPDGGLSASRYAYIGGFDGTSNVLAGQLFGIDVRGTHAHAFVSAFRSLQDLPASRSLKSADGAREEDFLKVVTKYRAQIPKANRSNEGELAAFISYALAFPKGFLALVDTYNTLNSGLLNFCAVALALNELGYRAVGIRLDSGDLAYLSTQARHKFQEIAQQFSLPWFAKLKIAASSDLSEGVIYSLNVQGHEIDIFGIGTNLVTCEGQPALGCVYKLVQVHQTPRIKLSNNIAKVTIPGAKTAFRLHSAEGPVVDLLQLASASAPVQGGPVYCRHPFEENRRVIVRPQKVEALHHLVWDGKLVNPHPSINEVRDYCRQQMASLRPDYVRAVNPTPYKVSVSEELYQLLHTLWMQESPVEEIS